MTVADRINTFLFGGPPIVPADLARLGLQGDLQGWCIEPQVLEQVIDQIKPRIIIEVGTWKGMSAYYMTTKAMAHGEVCTICVDTWLGSSEHWVAEHLRPMLNFQMGRPALYEQFVANMIIGGIHRNIVPMALPSRLASIVIAKVFAELNLAADLIYIDGAHDEPSVWEDITAYWPLLRSGGAMLGDDYDDQWPGVKNSADRFRRERADEIMTGGIAGHRWYVQKR